MDIGESINAWLERCPDPGSVPLVGMAEAGLLAPASSYVDIARGKAALVARTGLPGIAGVWGGPQVTARWFIAGFGNAEQQAVWLQRRISVAISEPGAGAHPKLLTTRADVIGDEFHISGEKAWVSNGPSADAFIVLAIIGERDDRKRYSAFVVPRETPGVTLNDMAGFHALRPSRHCGLLLQDVAVPRTAMLGPEGAAYEAMALPFRDIEDAVGTFTLLGAFRFLRARLTGADNEAASSLGAITGLMAVFADAAEAVVTAVDANRWSDKAATLTGLHVMAADLLQRLRAHVEPSDAVAQQLLADLDVLLSVAKGPRHTRQMRLGHGIGGR